MTYLIIGSALFLSGFSHLVPALGSNEHKVVAHIQRLINIKSWLGLFQEVWFLGRTSFCLIVILLLTAYQWKLGVVSGAVFLITGGIDTLVKISFQRPRPYQAQPALHMLQPWEPRDASFPSGDSFHIWFLALILPAAAGSDSLLWAGVVIASLVSAGRMVMGVHYLTDVLTGSGLGFLAAGTTIWIWRLLSLVQ